jgi:hypothetical protein
MLVTSIGQDTSTRAGRMPAPAGESNGSLKHRGVQA